MPVAIWGRGTLVEPDLDAGGAEHFANSLSQLRILRGIAEKYRVRRLGCEAATLVGRSSDGLLTRQLNRSDLIGRNYAASALEAAHHQSESLQRVASDPLRPVCDIRPDEIAATKRPFVSWGRLPACRDAGRRAPAYYRRFGDDPVPH